MKSLLILYEGDYSGVVQPGRHFVPLKKDHSNMADVVSALRDDSEVQKMVDRTFDEVVCNPRYSYDYLVELVDREVADAASRKGITASSVRTPATGDSKTAGGVASIRPARNWTLWVKRAEILFSQTINGLLPGRLRPAATNLVRSLWSGLLRLRRAARKGLAYFNGIPFASVGPMLHLIFKADAKTRWSLCRALFVLMGILSDAKVARRRLHAPVLFLTLNLDGQDLRLVTGPTPENGSVVTPNTFERYLANSSIRSFAWKPGNHLGLARIFRSQGGNLFPPEAAAIIQTEAKLFCRFMFTGEVIAVMTTASFDRNLSARTSQ